MRNTTNNTNRNLAAALVFGLAVLFGCKSETVEPQMEAITGVVKDVNGNPVAGAYLNFVFKMTPPSNTLPKGDEVHVPPSTTIRYEIPGRRYVRLVIENYAHEPIRVLVNDTLNGGSYEATWNGADGNGKFVYSDCYFYKLQIGDSLISRKMLFIMDQHLVTNPLAFAQTDNAGKFSIPLSRLPLNETFLVTSATGTPIGSSKLESVQDLYAFTSTHFGVSTVSLVEQREYTVILSRQK